MATLLEWFSEGKSSDTLTDNEAIPTDGNDTVSGTFKCDYSGSGSRIRINDVGNYDVVGQQIEIDQQLNYFCGARYEPPSTQSQMSIRFYWHQDATQGVLDPEYFRYYRADGGWHMLRQRGTDQGADAGKWVLDGDENVYTSSAVDNSDGWVRVELQIDTVNGTWDCRMWVSDHTSTGTADEDISGTVTESNIDELWFGNRSASGAALSPDHRFADILVTDTLEWLGPVGAGGPVELGASTASPSVSASGVLNVDKALSGDVSVSVAGDGGVSKSGIQLVTGDVDVSGLASGVLNAEHVLSDSAVTFGVTGEGPIINTPQSTDVEYAAYWADDSDERLDDPSARRKFDIYWPSGVVPEGGWPVVVWIHGGFFNSGSKANIGSSSTSGAAYSMLEECLDRGVAVVAPGYRLVAGFPNGESASITQHPDQLDDIQLLLSYLVDDASNLLINMDRLVLAGHSAGGYLAMMTGLIATTASPQSAPHYQHYSPAGSTTIDLRASSRYSGGPYTVQLVEPIGIASWEAPIDLQWNSYRESTVGVGITIDNAVRGYVGDDDHVAEGGPIGGSKVDHANIADIDGTTNYIDANSPPAFYVAVQGNTWATDSFVQTLDNGTSYTGGNGYGLEQAYSTAGVPMEALLASGVDHDDVNKAKSVEFVDWVEHLVALASFGGDASVQVSASGALISDAKRSAEFVPSVAAVFDATSVPQTRAISPEFVSSAAGAFDADVDPANLVELYPETAVSSAATPFAATVVVGTRTIDTVDFVSSTAAGLPAVVQPLSEDTKYPEFVSGVAQTFAASVTPDGVLDLYPEHVSGVAQALDASAVPKAYVQPEFVVSVANADFWAVVEGSGLNRTRVAEFVSQVAQVFEAEVVGGAPNDPTAAGWAAALATALDVSASNSKLARRVRAGTKRWSNGRRSLKDRVESELLNVREDA